MINAALSRDGKFLGIVYDDSDNSISTVIWEINTELHFTERAKFDTWARRIITVKSKRKEVNVEIPYESKMIIVYGENGHFYSPCGQIDPLTGRVEPAASSQIMAEVPRTFGYSGNGQYLVIKVSERSLIKLVSTQSAVTLEYLPWPKDASPIYACIEYVSTSGRYVLVNPIAPFKITVLF